MSPEIPSEQIWIDLSEGLPSGRYIHCGPDTHTRISRVETRARIQCSRSLYWGSPIPDILHGKRFLSGDCAPGFPVDSHPVCRATDALKSSASNCHSVSGSDNDSGIGGSSIKRSF